MTIFQFIVSACTGVAVGKKQKQKKGTRNTSAIAFIAVPERPSDQRDAGSVSPRRRFERMQPMDKMYDAKRAERVRDTMALRATEEPRLIKLMTTPQRKETMTALRGMGKFGETCRVEIAMVRFATINVVLCRCSIDTET